MDQFTVPQFIDVEDKIVGPLSVRQFIILLITFGVAALFYKLFDFSLFLVSGILTVMVGSLFAFAKVRGMELHNFLLCLIQTLLKPNLRVWNKWLDFEQDDLTLDDFNLTPKQAPADRRFTASHLNKLSLIVDTKGYYSGNDEEGSIYKPSDEPDDMLIG